MEKESKWDFLTSPRFWQLFLAGAMLGVQVYQNTGNWLSAVSAAIGSWLGGSVVVGTADKFSKKNTNTTVTIPAGVSNVSASTEPKAL